MVDSIYRQRLTGVGLCGVFLSVLSSLSGGFAVKSAIQVALNRYSFSDPWAYITFALACGIVSFIGLVMILVGREYYPHQETKTEPLSAPAPKEGPSLTEMHFGKSVDE